jgi:hypothetical protein
LPDDDELKLKVSKAVLSELSVRGQNSDLPPQTYPVEKSDTGRIKGRQKCQEKMKPFRRTLTAIGSKYLRKMRGAGVPRAMKGLHPAG